MKKSSAKDLTVGSPMKLLLSFMIPLMLGMLFQQFYNMVDVMIVGRFLGVDALAGVGSTGSINFMLTGGCMGICAGFAIPVAQAFGRHDETGLRRIVGNIIWLGVIIAGLMVVFTTTMCRQILIWMKNPSDTFEYAYSYISIIFAGLPAAMMYNLLAGIIRALGDSKTPLMFLIFSSLLNVVLDLTLILWAKMGVAGAALATVTSQLVSGILCLIYMIKRFPILHLSRDDLKFRKREASTLLVMGLPMGLQYSITAIGSVLLQTAVNGLGASSMAAMTAGNKISMFLVVPLDAIGTAATTFAGQNVGAGKLDRVHAGTRAGGLIGICYALCVFVVVYFFGDSIAALFLDSKEAEIVTMCHRFLITLSSFYICLLGVNLFRFTIQGMGYSRYAMFAGFFEMVARGGLAIGLVPQFGFQAVCFASPAAWIMADLFLIPTYFACMKKLGYQKPEKAAKSR